MHVYVCTHVSMFLTFTSYHSHHATIPQTDAVLLALLQVPDIFSGTGGRIVCPNDARDPEALGAVTMPPPQLLDEGALVVVGTDLPLAAADYDGALLYGEVVVGQEDGSGLVIGRELRRVEVQCELALLQIEDVVRDVPVGVDGGRAHVSFRRSVARSVRKLRLDTGRLRRNRGIG